MEDDKKKKFALPEPVRMVRNVLAVLVWAALLLDLFVFDVGSEIVRLFPVVEPVVRFRLLVLLGVIALLLLVLGYRRFLLFVAYILAYPVIALLWILPITAFRYWAYLVAFSPAVYGLLSSFRWTFALWVVTVISSFVACFADSQIAVVVAIAILAINLVVHFYKRFRVAFSTDTVFSKAANALKGSWEVLKYSEFAHPPDDLDRESEQYKTTFASRLLTIYMATTGLYIAGDKLKEVIASKKLDLYFVSTIAYTFVLSVVTFALEYFGLYRLSPGHFVATSEVSFLNFLAYSFSTAMTADPSMLSAASPLSNGFTYTQLGCSALILVLLAFIILTSIRERLNRDLDLVVSEIKGASDQLRGVIEANYDLTINAVETLLLRAGSAGLVRWLIKARLGEEEAKKIPGFLKDDDKAEGTTITVDQKPDPPDSGGSSLGL